MSFQLSNFHFQDRSRDKGFTLIELLIVMVVIGVLASLILVNMAGVRERARDARRKRDLDQVKKALGLYYTDYEIYPANSASNSIMGCGTDGDEDCGWGAGVGFEANDVVYMKRLPVDPVGGSREYRYEQTEMGDGFCLVAQLENGGDKDLEWSQTRCGGTWEENEYVVCED